MKMFKFVQHHFKSIYAFSMAGLFIAINVGTPLVVRADITWDDVNSVITNETFYERQCGAGGGNKSSGGSGTGKLYMIGDSITQGANSQLNTTLSGKGFNPVVIDGVASRSLSEGGDQLNGLGVMERSTDSIKDAGTVVIALGTNGGPTDAGIQKAIDIVKAASSNAKIYWVNIGADNSKRSGSPIPTDQWNNTIATNASKGYTVIDWGSVVKQHPEYINPDPAAGLGVHPIGPGIQAFADTVANGVTGGGTQKTTFENLTKALAFVNPKSLAGRLHNSLVNFFSPAAYAQTPTTDSKSNSDSNAPSPDTKGDTSTSTQQQLSLREQIAQLLFVRVDDQQQAQAVAAANLGGFYVRESSPNYPASFLDSSKINGIKPLFKTPPFVATDEEGGQIDPIKGANIGPAMPSAQAMGAKSVDEIKKIASDEASKLTSAGINVDFAPVVDLDNPNSEAIGKIQRSFSATPDGVVEKAGAFAEGLKSGGVTPTFKHFPGIGNTLKNSDFAAESTPPLDQLKASDLIPYQKLLAANTSGGWVMMSNYTVPGLTDKPASISKPAYDLLRNDYKYNGIIITDDLKAGGLPGSIVDNVVNAIRSGADIALFTGADQLKPIIDKLEQDANADPAFKAQIQASANKILAAKSGLGKTSAGDGSECCKAGATQLAGSDNAQKIWNFFGQKGLQPFQIAGIMGNMQSESHFTPDLVEYGTINSRGETSVPGQPSSHDDHPAAGGFGIVQFTPGTKILPNLEKYKQSSGSADTLPSDLSFQLELVWSQLEGSELASPLSEKAAGDELKASTDIVGATRAFELKYERHAGDAQQGRVDNANAILQMYGSGAGASSGSPSAASSSCSGASGGSALSGDIGNRIAEVAKQEFATNGGKCPTGSDCQKKYSDGNVEAWCADFASWVMKEAGSPMTGGTSGGWRVPASNSFRAWFEQNGEFHEKAGYTPKVGDIQINEEGNPTYPDHVAIVVAVNGNMATIIGGNDGSNLSQSQQPIDAPWVTGYGTKTK